MGWMTAERESELTRVRRLIDRHLVPAVYGPTVQLEIGAFHVPDEPVDVHTALAATYEPFRVGDAWGPLWGTTWFRFRASVPADWAGEEVVARVAVNQFQRTGFGAEGLVWVDGEPAQGISPNHDLIRIVSPARGGETVDFHVEAAANPQWHIADGVPGVTGVPSADPGGPPRCRLERAELTVRRPAVAELVVVMDHLLDLARILPVDEPRANELLAALVAACRRIDPRDVLGGVDAARSELDAVLARPAVASAHRLAAAGHSHIDSAWLWPVRETIRKCSRTFSTVMTLMDEFPDFRFVCSSAQQYAWVREHYPAVFERLRGKVADGQFEPVGSMWVESDCNLPSGESLVRQIVHGKRFFLEAFGIETTDLFLPDAFGYSPAFPQLMKLAGIDHFLSTKMSWNQTNHFPHDTFWWEGLDGSRVLAHFPPADTYNGDMSADELLATSRGFAEHGQVDSSLYLYGWGDGGGGPTREMIERMRLSADLEGLPKVEPQSLHDFFADLHEQAEGLPVWVGELYLELHRGTYTSQARTKQANRRGEIGLRAAELWSALAMPAPRYPAAELDTSWKTLLLQQFHDILPGSSIRWVYEDTAAQHAQVLATADDLVEGALAELTADVDTSGLVRPAIVANALTHDRTVLVDTDEGAVPVVVPALGYAAVDLAAPPAGPAGTVEAGPGWMRNEHLHVTWDQRGLLTSVRDLGADREVLAAGTVGNLLQLHRDEPNDHDAWDIDRFYLDDVEDLLDVASLELLESGPHRARLRVVRRFGESRIEQVLELTAGSRRLDVRTVVDWHERHVLLKVAFPVAIHATQATYEVQFGHIQRPTHENTSWDRARFEVYGHRWVDLSEADYGVALLNDGRYGHDVRGNVVRLSLLRAPTSPDAEADQGRHEFTYSLYPHQGDLRHGGVIEAAAELNDPVRIVHTSPHEGTRPPTASLLAVDRRGVVVEALKRADEGADVVVRLSDSWGQRGRVRLTPNDHVIRAVRTDLLERGLEPIEVVDGAIELDLRPFEVVTLRLEMADGVPGETSTPG